MRLADKVQEWLNEREWDDKINIDEENQASSLNFTFSIKDQGFNVWIETDEKREYFKVYYYVPFNALSKKFNECTILFNEINKRSRAGAIYLHDNKGVICWRHIIDFEGTDPSIITIQNAFDAGASTLDAWFDEITEVALTKSSAQEIIEQLDASSATEDAEEEVPDSI
jgi:hypothetical protein